jgi:hypothetical protein
MSIRATLAAVLVLTPATVLAQPTGTSDISPPAPSPAAAVTVPATPAAPTGDDGYCDYVEGNASADAATLVAPQLFGQGGYVEQPAFAINPSDNSSNLRLIGGVRWSLTNIYAGAVTKARAAADCRRHNALAQLPRMQNATAASALAARIRVYDDAQAEAQRILAASQADLEAKRTTAQEALAIRLRVEDLRTLANEARRQLASLPPVSPAAATDSTALERFYRADADVERNEAKLRTIRAWDLSMRAGADRFLEGANQNTQYFAVLELGINLGAIWVGSGNSRSAAGRARYARSSQDQTARALDESLGQTRALLDLEQQQIVGTQALVADLDKQIEALSQIPGDDSRKFRETIWFDDVKAKAELAYLQAHVASLRALLGTAAR